ncbi:MAG TPA: hypothetical protein VFD70_11040 [Anaerolineae bacterium]|nr:hypothetical protein [Anaerolineae bacterium]
MSDTLARLEPYRTDNLILLIGTNPLPNYVAARLLCAPRGKIHLVCSSGTASIAERLEKKLALDGLHFERRPVLSESRPQEIFSAIREMVMRMHGTVGLHYTGGTKAMSVHAYRAVKEVHSDAVCSYLDAHDLKMVIDRGMGDGRDDEIPVGKAVTLTVREIARLHKIEFEKSRDRPLLLDVARALQKDFESGKQWLSWVEQNLMTLQNKRKPKPANELRTKPMPSGEFPELGQTFMNLGAPVDATLEDWAIATCEFPNSSDGLKEFVGWLAGGYWLESIALDALLQIKESCELDDCGMGYVAEQSKFEFDVAATRGYQLFAFSCTTEDKDAMCKQKLFEGFERAKQMGGDEARTALVCYNRDPVNLLNKFKRENFFAEGTVRVFGANHMQDLPRYLAEWINNHKRRQS